MYKTAAALALFVILTASLLETGYGKEPTAPAEPSDASKEEAKKTDAREEARKKAQARREQMLKELQEQEAKEKAAALAKQAEYPYQSTKFIPVKNTTNNGRLFSFCLGADEKLYCLLTPSPGNPYELGGEKPKPQATATPEVVVLNLEGEELQRWELAFKPDRITTTAQGEIYVGGAGKLAKYSPHGKLLLEVELPHLAEVLKNEEELKAAAIEERDEQLEMAQTRAKSFEQYIQKKKEAKDKPKEKSGDKRAANSAANSEKPKTSLILDEGVEIEVDADEPLTEETLYMRLSLKQLTSMQENIQKQVDLLKSKSEEDLLRDFKNSVRNNNTIHALSMTGDSLVYTTRQVRGYGYAVWKLNAELAEPVKIVQGLGGCCGQCDVQCHNDKLYVADNTKHRVTVYDLSGKKLTQYGKKGRDGDGENFGGCCNPMNVSFTSTGQILTAESEGYIKCFSPTGEFEALLGRSLLESGCKHVALNMTKDGRYIIFLDQPGSRLVRLEKSAVKPSEAVPAEKTTSTVAPAEKSSE